MAKKLELQGRIKTNRQKFKENASKIYENVKQKPLADQNEDVNEAVSTQSGEFDEENADNNLLNTRNNTENDDNVSEFDHTSEKWDDENFETSSVVNDEELRNKKILESLLDLDDSFKDAETVKEIHLPQVVVDQITNVTKNTLDLVKKNRQERLLGDMKIELKMLQNCKLILKVITMK